MIGLDASDMSVTSQTRKGEREGEGGEEDEERRRDAVGTVLDTWCLMHV